MDNGRDAAAEGPIDISLGKKIPPDKPQEEEKGVRLPETVALLAVRDMSLFPRMVVPMQVGDRRHARLVDDVVAGNKIFGLVAFKGEQEPPVIKSQDQIYPVGVAALVIKMAKQDQGVRLVVQGLSRFRVLELLRYKPYLIARIEPLADITSDDMETMALTANLRALFARVLELAPHLPDELQTIAASLDSPGPLCDMVASAMNVSPDERQSIVEALEVKERLRRTTALLNREVQVLELGSKIQSQVKEGLDKSQREYYLRQQLQAIKKELGEEDTGESEVDEIQRKLDDKDLPEQVRAEADREVKRLRAMSPQSAEYHVITTYLDWIIRLPWLEDSEDHLDLGRARKVLETDHYDLDKVKRRILEYLSVRKLNPDMKGPILCLVGPPGVGKTSLGRSIARAMEREFARLSLGGVRDEAEIRGHRRTYVGALPGRIIQSLARAGKRNPVFMLDEIDKVGSDFRGDPSSALLEVLDPEQNNSFSDHYLDLAFDLSKVMFITTANVLDTIPGPLRDRMEVIEIPGYTRQDKLAIARRYLVPRQRKEHGLKAKQLAISDAAIRLLIDSYTREAGVRNLEREIGSLCRHGARLIAEGEAQKVSIGKAEVGEVLGPAKITPETAMRCSVPGVATGLAWTPFGGDILFVEATAMAGKGGLQLTGQLGDVMKESAQAAVSYVRANADELGIADDYFGEHDLHIHVPAGAIPKDGPSAGVTMFTSLVSLLTGRPVRPEVAMTGECTLRGMVLSVGGIKEKVLAAHRAGIRELILPERNQRDLEEVPAVVRKQLKFHFAGGVDEVINTALTSKERAKKASRPAGKKRPSPGKEEKTRKAACPA